MISPADLVKSVGSRGGLVVFFKAVCVYFLLGEWAGGSAPALMVAAKCAPVVCLAVLVAVQRGMYARRVALGLAASAVGDALLAATASEAGFVAGMGAFAVAHVCYVWALGWRPLAGGAGLALGAAGAAAALWLRPAAGPLALLVPAYALLLAAMAWRALAAGGAAAPAGLLFMLSDGLLGYNLFSGPLPHAKVLVMSTYYMAQLGLALSALRRPAALD